MTSFSQIVSTRELLVHGNVEELLALASERIFEYFLNIREPVFDCVFSFVGDIRVRFLFRDGVEIVEPIQIGLETRVKDPGSFGRARRAPGWSRVSSRGSPPLYRELF